MNTELIKLIMSNPPVVASFDFDDTIQFGVYRIPVKHYQGAIPEDATTRMPEEIKSIISRLYSLGTTLYVVTSRRDTEANRNHIIDFLTDNGAIQYFKDLILVGNDKAHKLQEIGSELHFDDDEVEFRILKKHYPDTKTQFIQIQHKEVPGEMRGDSSESWTMNKLALLAKFLKKSHPSEHKLLMKLAFVDESYRLLMESKFFIVASLYHNINTAEFKMWLDEFMDLNSEVFIKHPLKTIVGAGSYGAAFETEDGNVIKLFRGGDTYLDYVKRKKEYDSGRASKYSVEIYDIGMFNLPKYKRYQKTNDNQVLGWVVVEKLMIPEYSSFWESLHLFVAKNMVKIYDLKSIDDLHDKIYDIKLNFLNQNKKIKDIMIEQNISENNIEEFIWFVIDSYLKGENDLGYGNYGFRENFPVGFDSNAPAAQRKKDIFTKYPEMNVEYDDQDDDDKK